LDGNRFDCRSLRVWRGPERRLYTDLLFDQIGSDASLSNARSPRPAFERRDPLKGLETPKKESKVARVSTKIQY